MSKYTEEQFKKIVEFTGIALANPEFVDRACSSGATFEQIGNAAAKVAKGAVDKLINIERIQR
ncbi:MAG: hypothetical protein AAF810_01465 [Cyanobacteria bacterium P01_D01_bin.36]